MSTKTAKAPLAARVKNDPTLLARALKDPGLRSQLPDKYLNKDQRSARARREFIDNVGNIDEPLTGSSLVNVADQVTDRQYRPQYDALDNAATETVGQRDQQQRYSKSYYDQLNGILGNLTSSQAAAATQSVGDATARRDAALKAIDDAGAAVADRAKADEAVRGSATAGVADADLAAQQAAARDRATTGGQTAIDAAQANNDANTALLRNIQGATAQRGGEVQGQISTAARNALADLTSKRQELATNEGEDRTKNLVDLRKNEVDRLLTEKGISSDLTQAGIDADLKAKEIRSTTDLAREKMRYQLKLEQLGYNHDDARQAADQQFRAQQNDLDRRNAVTVKKTASPSTTADRPEFTNSEKHSNMKSATNAIGAGSSLKSGGQDRATALQYLTDKYGDIYARIAVNLAYDGGKGQKHLRQELLQLAGIHLPDKYIKK